MNISLVVFVSSIVEANLGGQVFQSKIFLYKRKEQNTAIIAKR